MIETINNIGKTCFFQCGHPVSYTHLGTFEQFKNEPMAYVEYVVFSGMETVTLSNYIAPPQKGQKLHIWLRRKNGFYTVKLAEVA